MKVLLAHPGTQYSFQLARQLYKRNLLYEFHTGFAFGKDSWVYKLFSRLPDKIYHKISNRFIEDVPDRYLRRQLLLEIKALILLKLGRDEENVLYKRNRQFQDDISDASIEAADIVIGFDTSSWILAQRCRKLAKNFILDVSIAHPVSKDNVYRQIIKLYPTWKFALKQKAHQHIAIEEMEMELATHIVVASSFTLGTFVAQGIPTKKISVNPYGVDTGLFQPAVKKRSSNDLVRFVFVGTVDARKGIPFLLEVWNDLSHAGAELTLIGPVTHVIEKMINNNYPSVIVKGKISFKEVKDVLPNYDVMIFPSFFEGYGLVIPEAMACGLPVITTTATCASDIFEDSIEGFIVGPGEKDKLKPAIEYFIAHPEQANQMGLLARKKAEKLSWDAYGDKWHEIIKLFI